MNTLIEYVLGAIFGAIGGFLLALLVWLFASFIEWELLQIHWGTVRGCMALGVGFVWFSLILDMRY